MKTLIARTAGLLLAAAPLTLVGSGAQAEAKLVSATPAAGAVVGAPQMVQLQFNEKLDPTQSAANLTDEQGAPIPVATKTDGVTIQATPEEMLAPGTYVVMWRAMSATGEDRAQDAYRFTIR